MAKNVLFLIHGVGEQSEDWAKEEDGPIPALKEAAQNYRFFDGKTLEDLIEFVPIRYDDIFDRILKHWSDLSKSITENAGGISNSIINDTLDLLQKAGDDQNKFLTYGGDVLLYRGFKLFSQRVQVRVISKIAETIAKRTSEPSGTPVRFSIAAHSMGTAVIHDALQHLGTESWLQDDYNYPEDKNQADTEGQQFRKAVEVLRGTVPNNNPFSPETFRFDSLFMLSNTSRLLHTTKLAPDKSIVKPGTDGHNESYLRSYLNFDHKYDPISKVKKFRAPLAWKAFGGGIDISNLDHFFDRNIHGFSHYLKHPNVHLRLFISLINSYEPSPEDIKSLQNFPQWGGKFAGAPDHKLKGKLGEIVEKSKAGKSINHWLGVYQTLKTLLKG